MFDKWKTKNALCKAYELYNNKKIPYLTVGTMNLYEQLQDIQYAIAYVLCECFDFNYKFYYNDYPFSYKWLIANDYINHCDECKEAYEKIVKENNIIKCNWSLNDIYSKGDIIYNLKDGCFYRYDGKNLINMC